MTVDSFKFLPRLIASFYQTTDIQPAYPIPWTPLPHPLSECKFGLVTSAGLYHKGVEPPFDLQKEQNEPTWGDPSYRIIPTNLTQEEIGVSHLHVNTSGIETDVNIVLPIHRFQELVNSGYIGGLAQHAYSFMGFQGFPPDASAWQNEYGPQVAEKLKAEAVDCVFMTPS
jgi:D-proline reductase (dithiol) PrdB